MQMHDNELRIGVVGLGFVGSAIVNAARIKGKHVKTYDIDPLKDSNCSSLDELVHNSDIIYVAVPTPMNIKTGECDVSIVENTIFQIINISKICKQIVIKSTVPPGTTERLQGTTKIHNIFFSPEFLTEAAPLDDFVNARVVILGKPSDVNNWIAKEVLDNQRGLTKMNHAPHIMDATAAELYKYTANIFLATKVSFANEMKTIADQLGVEWNTIVDVLHDDPRMGRTHWNAPGPDGKYGFGGTCFPKDLSALIHLEDIKQLPLPILSAVQYRNNNIDRPEKDWHSLKGRAISE